MLALISPAKIMTSESILNIPKKYCTKTQFKENTDFILSQMLNYNADELHEIFKINHVLAKELRSRFLSIQNNTNSILPAVDTYNGVVYKHFKYNINENNLEFVQKHIRISSVFYGLLKPLDLISPYRMEGYIYLAETGEKVDKYWRNIQTQTLIDEVNAYGGTLLYLASKEEQNSFNWTQVKKQVRVIDFRFLQQKSGKLKQVVIYTKMARGEMLSYIIKNKITTPEKLKDFTWNGYYFDPSTSTDDVWNWVMI